MTRVGFWRQVERFFGPPSHAMTAVRAVYIARSSGRCLVCGVKPETRAQEFERVRDRHRRGGEDDRVVLGEE